MSQPDATTPTDDDGIPLDGRLPSSNMRSYALLTPDLKELYMGFYKATYGKSRLDIKTKEYIAIAAALTLGCKGCSRAISRRPRSTARPRKTSRRSSP